MNATPYKNAFDIINMFGGVSSNKEMFISLMTSTEENNLKSVSIYVNECNIS